jgi:hypothetical protein
MCCLPESRRETNDREGEGTIEGIDKELVPAGFVHKLPTERTPLFFPTAMTIGVRCLGVVS